MKLHDLKNAMVISTKGNDSLYLVLTDVASPQSPDKEDYVFVSENGFLYGSQYNEDMTLKSITFGDQTYWDIQKVYKRVSPYTKGEHCAPHSLTDVFDMPHLELIWERGREPQEDTELIEDDKIAESDEFSSKEITFF